MEFSQNAPHDAARPGGAPTPSASAYDVLILGAGTAGLFCAREAARRGLRVALVDHQAKPGRKLALAGGGMGNVTNRTLDPAYYVGEHPERCRPALKKFGANDALALLRELGIPWEERDFGQIFCLRPASELAAALARQCREAGVDFYLGQKPEHVGAWPVRAELDVRQGAKRDERPAASVGNSGGAPAKNSSSPKSFSGDFSLRLGHIELRAAQMVLATGSPAWPQCGATDFGARLARAWGHRLVPFRPVLAPFILPASSPSSAPWPLRGLEGISLNARVTVRPVRPTGNAVQAVGPMQTVRPLLFTHKGVSGPAALIASAFWREGDELVFDFLPDNPMAELLHQPENGKLLVKNLLARRLPERLAERLCPEDLARRKTAELSKADRQRLAGAVHAHTVVPEGTEDFRKAEAAAGGVALDDVDARLESRIVPGLFFCGEILDITGLLGGYNIHWALASAKLVASALHPGSQNA